MNVDYRKTIFSPRWFIENLLYIVDKKGKLIKFKMNAEQEKMMTHIEFCLNNDLPIRMIVLKARQIGSTTFFSAIGFWMASMNVNATYGIVAHRLDSAESIFQKCKVYYNNMPKELQPSTTQMSGDGITFDKKNGKGINSKIKFATVNDGVFRGQTLRYLHLTECAFWEGKVQAIENSLAPTVSINAGTMIVRESTANGYNFFKDDWDRAVKGQSEYTPFFFGWQDHEEYVMDIPDDFKCDNDEQKIKDHFGLTNQQVMWRRYQINNNYSGNEMWFKQENPMTPEEAFVASGGGVFDSEIIQEGYRNAKKPEKEIAMNSYPMFEKLKVWEFPTTIDKKIYHQKAEWSFELQDYVYVDTDLLLEEQHFYIPYTIGVDTSGMGADKNQIVVINNITKKVAARLEKKNISEEHLAKIVVEIAKMYNNAMVAPEINYSHSLVDFIVKLGYKNLYIMEDIVREDQKITGGIVYGWKTTNPSKTRLIGHLKSILNESPSVIPDKEFWYEAEYFLLEDAVKNIVGAASGHFDDIIMATAIGMFVSDSFQSRQSMQVVSKRMVEEGKTHWMNENLAKKYKRTPLKKGIYTNRA